MARCDIIAPTGQRFELVEVRICPCVGLDAPFLVAVAPNTTLYLSYWIFLADGWRFAPRAQQSRADVAKSLWAS